MSHSSRSHGSAVHQSPDVRQGPARSRILPRMPSAAMKLGWPEARATRAARGGRNMRRESLHEQEGRPGGRPRTGGSALLVNRKSTRLNSSHLGTSYAAFCLKKKDQHKFTDPGLARHTAHAVGCGARVDL